MEFSSGVDRWMPRDEVVRLVSEWSDLGVTVWLDGGWAVDAVLGVETRPHGDLDVVVVDVDVPRIVAHLNACG
jgi:lincosamide nucleotidyltransferase A/C/D/E